MFAPLASAPMMSLATASAPAPVLNPRNAVIRYTLTPMASIEVDARSNARVDAELFAAAVSVEVEVGT
jgi:hypothetical protein